MAKSLRAMTLAAARAAGIGTAFEVPQAPREYVKLIQARELPNDAGEIVQRLVNSGGHRMVGYLRRDADGDYFCLTETKARNPETRRRSKCFGFVRCTPGANGVGMNWYFVPAKEPELARIALACYRDTDELPPYDALAAGQITVKESE